MKRENKGITLIALIVTIIVMLILVTVTIRTLISNGLFKHAGNAVGKYQQEEEREVLSERVLSYKIGKYMNKTESKLGIPLLNKNLDNSSTWNLIIQNSDKKTYGTDWNYIPKGTEIENYGKAEHNWVVNYETGEIVELEDDTYTPLSAGDMVAIKDSFIIIVDSSIIDDNLKNDEETLEKQLGENVDLVNFDYNSESGLTSTSFNFDGKDDYIKVQYDSVEQKKLLTERGFTFEFYGTLNGGTSVIVGNNNPEPYSHYKGLFCYWSGVDGQQADLRFGLARRW